MIQETDRKDIMSAIRQDFPSATERDIAYVIISSEIADKRLAYDLAYGRVAATYDKHNESKLIRKMTELLIPYGIGEKRGLTINKDQNTQEMLRLLKDIEQARKDGSIETKDALNMEKDIRAKLQDKFDIGESKEQKRIIIVPQKHDIICPHTNRECTSMPSKDACIKYYHLECTKENEN